VHKLIARFVQEGPQKNPIPNMASGVHRLSPISPRSSMLVKHRPSHLTKGTNFPLNHTVLTSHIGRRKLIFETQITTKGFEMRVFKFTAIVATNSSNSISMSLVFQPLDHISHKTKRLPLVSQKEDPNIARIVVHNHKDRPLPTRRAHTSWTNQVHMEQLARSLCHNGCQRRMIRGDHLAMLTRSTYQILLVFQLRQSSD
jgi:hypothetical protein